MVRAISKAGDLLTSLNYGDETTAAKVKDIVATARQFSNSFDEKELFKVCSSFFTSIWLEQESKRMGGLNSILFSQES